MLPEGWKIAVFAVGIWVVGAVVMYILANLYATWIGLSQLNDPSTQLVRPAAEDEYTGKLESLNLSDSLVDDIGGVLESSSHGVQYGYLRSETSSYWVCAVQTFDSVHHDALPLTWLVPRPDDQWICAAVDGRKRIADVDPDRITIVE